MIADSVRAGQGLQGAKTNGGVVCNHITTPPHSSLVSASTASMRLSSSFVRLSRSLRGQL